MLFYSLYALTGFLTGAYILYNFNTLHLLIAVILFLMLLFFISKNKQKPLVLSFLIFSIFSGAGFVSMHKMSKTSCYTNEFVTVTGRVSELPYQTESSWCYILDCTTLNYGGNILPFKNRITVYSENEYTLDDTLNVSGFLKLHNREKNPGCFNSYTYYKSIGIDYKISAFSDCISKTAIKSYSPYAYAMRLRAKVCEIIDSTFKADNAAILKYILTNFRKDLDSDYTNTLLTTGVSRCLYSPYFHLVIILMFINLIFKKSPKNAKRVIICTACIIYLCINPYSLTGRKLFTFTIISEFLRAKAKIFRPLDALFTAILLCAVQNPYVIYNEGFMMSCIATFFIIVFYGKIFKQISWINSHKEIVRVSVLFFVSGFLMLPLSAFFFEGISFYSILVSMLLLPVICFIYIISPLTLLEATLFKGFCPAEIITDSLVSFIRNIPWAIEKLPFSYINLPRPPLTLLICILVFLGAIYKRKSKKLFPILLSVSLGFGFSFTIGEFYRSGKMTVTFLDVGQGDCTVTDIPYKCTVMVDGGGSADYGDDNKSTYDVGAKDVFPYLRHNNIRTLDYVFVSHYHKDHADGIVSLMDKVKIKNIFLPNCLPKTEYRVIIEEKAKKYGIKLYYISEPGTIQLDDGLNAEILYFDKDAKDENDTSVVMRLAYNGLSCLYTGDITKTAEEKVLASGVNLKTDILKVAHHSSGSSSGTEFLKAASPQFAIAMLAQENTYGFPAPETVENFNSLNIPFITTAEYGCIQFKETFGRLSWQKKTH